MSAQRISAIVTLLARYALGEIAVPKKRIKAALKLLDLVPDAAAGASPKGSTLPDATTERGRSILSGVMNDEGVELATRLAAAKALLPYSFRPDDGDEAPVLGAESDDWLMSGPRGRRIH